MTDKPTTAPRQEAVTMAAKVTGEGPMALTTAEANALRGMVREMLELQSHLQAQVLELSNLTTAMTTALKGRQLQLTHIEHEDGTISFDLEHAPSQVADKPATMN